MLRMERSTLRRWEDRYRVVQPERAKAGRRLYSRDDVEQLRFVKEQVDRGVSAADAHRGAPSHGRPPGDR
jgi:DNA-binding transcriptional MerR regulator